MKKLLEGDLKLKQRYNVTMADLGIGDVTENIDGVIRVMMKRGLIEIADNIIRLTPKGRTKAKRIKKY